MYRKSKKTFNFKALTFERLNFGWIFQKDSVFLSQLILLWCCSLMVPNLILGGPDLSPPPVKPQDTTCDATPLISLNQIEITARGYKNLSNSYLSVKPEHYFPTTSQFVNENSFFLQYDDQLYFVTLKTFLESNTVGSSFQLVTDHLDNQWKTIQVKQKPFHYYPKTRVCLYRTKEKEIWAFLPEESIQMKIASSIPLSNKDYQFLEEENILLALNDQNELVAYNLIQKTEKILFKRVIDYQFAYKDKKLFVLQFGSHADSRIGQVFIHDMTYPDAKIPEKPIFDQVSAMVYLEYEGRLFVCQYVNTMMANLYDANMLTYPSLTFNLCLQQVAHHFSNDDGLIRPYFNPKIEYIPQFHAIAVLAYTIAPLKNSGLNSRGEPIGMGFAPNQPSVNEQVFPLKQLYLADVAGESIELVAPNIFDYDFDPYQPAFILYTRNDNQPVFPDRNDSDTKILFQRQHEGSKILETNLYGPVQHYGYHKTSQLLCYHFLDSMDRLRLRVRDAQNGRMLINQAGILSEVSDMVANGLTVQSDYYEKLGIRKIYYALDYKYAVEQNQIQYRSIPFPVDPPNNTSYLNVVIMDHTDSTILHPAVPKEPDDAPLLADIPHTTQVIPSVEQQQYQEKVNRLLNLYNTGKSVIPVKNYQWELDKADPGLHYDSTFTRSPVFMNTLIYPDGSMVTIPCEYLTISPSFTYMILLKRTYLIDKGKTIPKDVLFLYEVNRE